MTKKNGTKRSLLMSAVALVLCFSMLVGSTFAWFTDSVTSSGNIIKSGTLDVEMYWAKGTDDPNADATTWTDASTGAIFNNDKWEPGYVEVRHIKIENKGTLALKYQLNIVANGDVSDLADVIDVYFVDPAAQAADRTLANMTKIGTLTQVLAGMPNNVSGDIEAGAAPDIVTIALKMQESAGNEYQELSIGSDFSVQLFATQLTAEEDSFDDQYDAGANYEGEVDSAEELAAAMLKGGNIVVLGTITDTTLEAYSETRNVVALYRPAQDSTLSGGKIVLDNSTANWGFVVDAKNNVNVTVKDTEIVGNNNWNMHNIVAPGSKLTIENVKVSATGGSGIYVTGGGEAVINNATVAQDGLNAGAQPWAPTAVATSTGSTVTINGGTYEGTTYGVYIYNSGAKVTINDGTFKAPQVLKADGSYTDQTVRGEFVVNGGNFDGQINMTNGYAYCAINGGNFTNFSVSTYSPVVIKGGTFDADPSAYVADGYVATDNGDGTWTVAMNQTGFENAISNAADGDTLTLGSGTYTIPDSAQGKTLTIVGNGDTTVSVVDDGGSEGDIDYSFSGSNVTFENVTLNIQGSSYPGYAGLSATYNDCTIIGSNYTLYGNSVFNNCTFNLNNGYVWTWGAAEVEFNGCTFEDTVGGKAKAILVHNTVETVVTVKDCTFKATTPAQTWDGIPVAAVSIDPENGSPDAKVYFEGTNTYDSAFNSLYQVKYTSEVDDVKVYVNGVEQTLTAMKEG